MAVHCSDLNNCPLLTLVRMMIGTLNCTIFTYMTTKLHKIQTYRQKSCYRTLIVTSIHHMGRSHSQEEERQTEIQT